MVKCFHTQQFQYGARVFIYCTWFLSFFDQHGDFKTIPY